MNRILQKETERTEGVGFRNLRFLCYLLLNLPVRKGVTAADAQD